MSEASPVFVARQWVARFSQEKIVESFTRLCEETLAMPDSGGKTKRLQYNALLSSELRALGAFPSLPKGVYFPPEPASE